MIATDRPILHDPGPGEHVCWILDDGAAALAHAARIEAAGAQHRQKTLVFGPRDSRLRTSVAPHVSVAADPWTDVLGADRFDPDAMYQMFRERTASALAEGYRGLRLVADMDWLLPLELPTSEIVGFELMLDGVVQELGATVVCAYRRASFDDHARHAVACVHPINVGLDADPQFQIVADDAGWRLTGEVDHAVTDVFTGAIAAAFRSRSCRLDVSGLEFIDVAGTRALARAASVHPITIVGRCAPLERLWVAGRFASIAPAVRFEGSRG